MINILPSLFDCLKEWPEQPSEEQFDQIYLGQNQAVLKPLLDDFLGFRGITFYECLEDLDWKAYRKRVLSHLVPEKSEANVRHQIEKVEKLLNVKLSGETVVFGAFTLMDGYARFNEGTHRVFLGLDEEFPSDECRDVLITHELTHVARESRPETWTDFGLSPKLNHDDMVKVLPTIEHLFGEGFSCLVSELLNPGLSEGSYVYQNDNSYEDAMRNAENINTVVHGILKEGSYRELYNLNHYAPEVPRFAHYLWAWRWVKHLYAKHDNDIQKLLALNTSTVIEDALQFKLE